MQYVRKKMKKTSQDGMLLDLATGFYLPTRQQFMDALERAKNIPLLGCWCKPLACHADNYVKYFNWLETQ